jgi:dCTP deaminase
MCIVGKDRLVELIKKYKVIHPFEERLLDGDGYVLTVKEDITLNYLEHRNVVSHQIVHTPTNYVAHLTAKSRFGRLGLSFLNSVKVHSGWVGRLALELVNLSNERTPITIRRGQPLIHIELISREGKPSPYVGEYQFQFMTKEEVQTYLPILKETIPNYEEYEKLWFKKA